MARLRVLAVVLVAGCTASADPAPTVTVRETVTATETVTPDPDPPPPAAGPITISGTGRENTDPVLVPAGDYRIAWDLADDCLYGIDLEPLDGQGAETLVLASTGPTAGQDNLYGVEGGAYYASMETGEHGSCAWSVTLTPR